EALGLLQRACQIDANHAAAHNGLGEAYIDADRPEDAEACFRTAIELSPELAIPAYNLGIALQAQGREPEAVVEFRRAIALDPALAQAQMRLGSFLLENGQ